MPHPLHLSCIWKELNTYLPTKLSRLGFSFDIIKMYFSLVVRPMKWIGACSIQRSIRGSLSFSNNGHSKRKWASSSILFTQILHFLADLSRNGFWCLPFSIMSWWHDNLSRVRAFLCLQFFMTLRYSSILISFLWILYSSALDSWLISLFQISLYSASFFRLCAQ